MTLDKCSVTKPWSKDIWFKPCRIRLGLGSVIYSVPNHRNGPIPLMVATRLILVAAWESREVLGPDESGWEFLVLEISSQSDPAFQHILEHAMNMVRRMVMLLGWVEGRSVRGVGAYLKRVSSYLRSYSWLARLICIVFVKSHARTVKSNLNEVFHQSVILLSKSFICSMAV